MYLRAALAILVMVFSVDVWSNLSPRIYNQLNDLQVQLDEATTDAEVAEIKQELLELKQDLKGNSLGVALSLQTLAQIEVRTGDLAKAAELISEATELKGLPDGTLIQLRTFLANLFYQQDQYKKTIQILSDVFAQDEKSRAPSNLALMAAAYYSLEDFENGTPYIDEANRLAKEPKQSWLQMAFAGHYQLKQYDQALVYVTRLVYLYPENSRYWQQKAGMHQLMEDYSQASAVKYLSYLQGVMEKESDYLTLGRLLASQGGPYYTATMLKESLDSGALEASEDVLRLVYQGFLQAKEMQKALQELKTLYEAYPSEDDGIQLMRLLIDQESWQQVVEFYVRFQKQEVDDDVTAEAALLAGIAQYRLGQESKAKSLFSQAALSDKQASQAKAWLNYMAQMRQ